MKNNEEIKLKALLDKDVEKLLFALGILDNVTKGEIKCFCCNDPIDLKNFGGIIRKEGKIHLFCDKIECFTKVLELRKKVNTNE